MRFGRTRASLDALQSRSEVTALDVLNIFYDLCEDIKEEAGEPTEKLISGDEGTLVTRLGWTGRKILKIAENQPLGEIETRRRERLKNVCESIEAVMKELEKTEETMRQIEEEEERLKGYQAELEEEKNKRKEKEIQCQKRNEQCRLLEEEADSYREIEIPELNQRVEFLEAQLQDWKEEKKKRERQCLALKEKQKEMERECQRLEEMGQRQMEANGEEQGRILELETRMQEIRSQTEQTAETIRLRKEELRNLEEDQRTRRNELETLLQWFDSEKVKDGKKRLEQCESRIRILREAKDALEREWGMITKELGPEPQEEGTAFMGKSEQILRRLENGIEGYRKCYNDMLKRWKEEEPRI